MSIIFGVLFAKLASVIFQDIHRMVHKKPLQGHFLL